MALDQSDRVVYCFADASGSVVEVSDPLVVARAVARGDIHEESKVWSGRRVWGQTEFLCAFGPQRREGSISGSSLAAVAERERREFEEWCELEERGEAGDF